MKTKFPFIICIFLGILNVKAFGQNKPFGDYDMQTFSGSNVHAKLSEFFCPHGKVHCCSICMPNNKSSCNCESLGIQYYQARVENINCYRDENKITNTWQGNSCRTLDQKEQQAALAYGACIGNANKGILSGLNFPGTPEQQQAALQRQLMNQNIGSAMNTLQQGFAKGSQQTLDQFANQTAGNQGKVDAINNQGNSNQPRDDKGIMDAARSNNQSTDNLGPGQEMDEDDKKFQNDPETKRLTGLTDAQYEAEGQRLTERNKDRPADAMSNYDTGTSRLAGSEGDIQRQREANTSDTTPADANPSGDSVQKTLMDNVRNFVDGIKEKGFNWANFTDEEKVKAAYLGYSALSASQSVIGGLLFTLNPIGSGFLLGTGAFSKALYDQVEITNPFLRDWSKK